MGSSRGGGVVGESVAVGTGPKALNVTLPVDVGLVLLVILVGTNAAVVAESRYGVPSSVLPLAFLILVGRAYEIRLREPGLRSAVHSYLADLLILRWAFGAFLIYAIVLLSSSIGARDPDGALNAGQTWLTGILIVAAIAIPAHDPRRLRLVRNAVVACLFVLAIPTVVQRTTGSFSFEWFGMARAVQSQIVTGTRWRSEGPIESNAFGAWLVIYMPIAALAYRSARTRLERNAAGLSIVFAAGAVFSTYSRGPLLGMAAISAPLLLMVIGRSRLAAAALATTILGATLISPQFWRDQGENLAEVMRALRGDVGGDTSTAGHLSTARAGMEMFRDNPLRGVGARNFVEHYLDYSDEIGIDTSEKARSAHNSYVQVAAETGLIGLLVVTAGFVLLGLALVSARRRAVEGREGTFAIDAIAIALTGFAITSLFRSTSHPQALWIVIAIALAYSSSSTVLVPRTSERSTQSRSEGHTESHPQSVEHTDLL